MKSKKRPSQKQLMTAWKSNENGSRKLRKLSPFPEKENQITSSTSSNFSVMSQSSATSMTTAILRAEVGKGAFKDSLESHRQAVRTHETREKKSAIQLRLHLVKTKREMNALKILLSSWDPQEQEEIYQKELLEKQKIEEENQLSIEELKKLKKRMRKQPGPETWKLKGAARPASMVYDFDVRYVDPYQKALNSFKEKKNRSVNLLALYHGKLTKALTEYGNKLSSDSLQSETSNDNQPGDSNPIKLNSRLVMLLRQYLSSLMQCGHLSLESNHFKTARETWLECVQLEGTFHGIEPLTSAREALIRMHLISKRTNDAWNFLTTQIPNDVSPWIAYARALTAVQIQKSSDEIESFMVQAIRSNVYCAYYLAFVETFQHAMEYTSDLEEHDKAPLSDLERAIEYCTDDAMMCTWESSGARAILRKVLLDAISSHHKTLMASEVEWKERLYRLQGELRKIENEQQNAGDESGDDCPPDVLMYAGMFITAMEMLHEKGALGVNPLCQNSFDK